MNFLSGCLPQLVQSQRSLAGHSLIIWLTAGQPFIFLFISGALNWHSLSDVQHRRASESDPSRLGRCESCVPCFTSKIDFFRVVEWGTSGLCGLIKPTYNISHVENTDEDMFTPENTSALNPEMCFSSFVFQVCDWIPLTQSGSSLAYIRVILPPFVMSEKARS